MIRFIVVLLATVGLMALLTFIGRWMDIEPVLLFSTMGIVFGIERLYDKALGGRA